MIRCKCCGGNVEDGNELNINVILSSQLHLHDKKLHGVYYALYITRKGTQVSFTIPVVSACPNASSSLYEQALKRAKQVLRRLSITVRSFSLCKRKVIKIRPLLILTDRSPEGNRERW